MPIYNETDFMPKDTDGQKPDTDPTEPDTDTVDMDTAADDEGPMEQLDLSPEQMPEALRPVPGAHGDPEIGAAAITPSHNSWAGYVSAIFSPLLMPTYCMALAMWITPLSKVNENTRLIATFVILLLTAVAPMMYIVTMTRLGYIKHVDMAIRRHRIAPTLIAIVGMVLAIVYLHRAKAPDWLMMVFVAAIVNALAYFAINFFTLVSGHTMGMGAFTALVYYLGANNISDVTITPWVMAIVLLSGLVGSARLALGRHTTADVAIGYVVGAAVTYAVLHIDIFG